MSEVRRKCVVALSPAEYNSSEQGFELICAEKGSKVLTDNTFYIYCFLYYFNIFSKEVPSMKEGNKVKIQ